MITVANHHIFRIGRANIVCTKISITDPMAIFAMFGVLALIVALMLKVENKKKGYGLEEANIQK